MIAFEVSGFLNGKVTFISEPYTCGSKLPGKIFLRDRILDENNSAVFDDSVTPPRVLWSAIGLQWVAQFGGNHVPPFCQYAGNIVETATGKPVMEGPTA